MLIGQGSELHDPHSRPLSQFFLPAGLGAYPLMKHYGVISLILARKIRPGRTLNSMTLRVEQRNMCIVGPCCSAT